MNADELMSTAPLEVQQHYELEGLRKRCAELELSNRGWPYVCIHHTDAERLANHPMCPVCASARIAQLEADAKLVTEAADETHKENAELNEANDMLQEQIDNMVNGVGAMGYMREKQEKRLAQLEAAARLALRWLDSGLPDGRGQGWKRAASVEVIPALEAALKEEGK